MEIEDIHLLKAIFEYLKAGKNIEVQESLVQTGHHEKFLWLIGSQPHFDNIDFTQRLDCDELIPSDTDRECNIDLINKTA